MGRLLGTAGGAWLLTSVNPGRLNAVVGAATLLAAVVTIVAPSFDPARKAFLSAGVITGISETATGVGGPPLALVYQHQPGPTLRSTIALCFLAGEVISLTLLALMGRVGTEQVRAAALLVPALGLGSILSQRIHDRVDGRVLRRIVLGFAITSAMFLLVRA